MTFSRGDKVLIKMRPFESYRHRVKPTTEACMLTDDEVMWLSEILTVDRTTFNDHVVVVHPQLGRKTLPADCLAVYPSSKND